MKNYIAGASYCRRNAMKGGSCILVLNCNKFVTVNLDKYCIDFDFEISAVKIQNESLSLYILSVYRAPMGNFSNFMLKMEVLKSSYTFKTEFIICGYFNIDYLTDNYRKNQLNSLLNTFNLFSTVNFPTRATITSKTAIDNIFIDYSRIEKCELSPMYNGISDHDAQLVLIHDITIFSHSKRSRTKRKIYKSSLLNFSLSLSTEQWKEIFDKKEVNIMFNTFLNIFLRYFCNSFPKICARFYINTKAWITSSIKSKSNIKRHLYISYKESNNPNIQTYYRIFCKALSRNIVKVKCLYYDEQIKKSQNTTKTTWNIVKSLTGRKPHHETIPDLNVFDKSYINTKMVVDSFNKYLVSIAETITKSTLNNSDISNICNKANEYLINTFKIAFPSISYSYATTNEIGNIIDKMKLTHASGYDEILNKVLKICKHFYYFTFNLYNK
jgi:hypothetical protein